MTDGQRRRSKDEAKVAACNSLRTVEALSELYDNGHYDIARDIATIVHRLMVDELGQTGLRRNLKFISVHHAPSAENLLPQSLTTDIEVRFKKVAHGDPTIATTHVPVFEDIPEKSGRAATILKFNNWWNETVLIDGAANGTAIPIDDSRHVPFGKRKTASRRKLITVFRQKIGAHYDHTVGSDTREIEDQLLRSIDLAIKLDDGRSFNYSETPEVFVFDNARSQAIVRHIAFEIVKSSRNWEFVVNS